MTTQGQIDLVNEAKKWLGYEEKAKLGDVSIYYDKPESFTNKTGKYNNFTVFSEYYENTTGLTAQGMAWCATFVNCMYIKVFGVEKARKLLQGFTLWTPTLAQNTKASKKNPLKIGIPIFFKNSQRIHHTGIITGFDGTYIYTIEGNTRKSNDVIAEGHTVAQKKYLRDNPSIAGWGLIEFSDNIKTGWISIDNGDYVYRKNGQNLKNGFYSIDGIVYHFDDKGIMNKGQFFVNGTRYFATDNGYLVHITDGLESGKEVNI